jgi:hypothetical protein
MAANFSNSERGVKPGASGLKQALQLRENGAQAQIVFEE